MGKPRPYLSVHLPAFFHSPLKSAQEVDLTVEGGREGGVKRQRIRTGAGLFWLLLRFHSSQCRAALRALFSPRKMFHAYHIMRLEAPSSPSLARSSGPTLSTDLPKILCECPRVPQTSLCALDAGQALGRSGADQALGGQALPADEDLKQTCTSVPAPDLNGVSGRPVTALQCFCLCSEPSVKTRSHHLPEPPWEAAKAHRTGAWQGPLTVGLFCKLLVSELTPLPSSPLLRPPRSSKRTTRKLTTRGRMEPKKMLYILYKLYIYLNVNNIHIYICYSTVKKEGYPAIFPNMAEP